jgi:hypothetical protein
MHPLSNFQNSLTINRFLIIGAYFQILRYFPTTPGKTDSLSTGQFFACMRLVLHAQAGRDPAKALVFVQGMASLHIFPRKPADSEQCPSDPFLMPQIVSNNSECVQNP